MKWPPSPSKDRRWIPIFALIPKRCPACQRKFWLEEGWCWEETHWWGQVLTYRHYRCNECRFLPEDEPPPEALSHMYRGLIS